MGTRKISGCQTPAVDGRWSLLVLTSSIGAYSVSGHGCLQCRGEMGIKWLQPKIMPKSSANNWPVNSLQDD